MASNRAKYPKEMKTETVASIVDSERSTTSMYDFPAQKNHTRFLSSMVVDLVGGDGSHLPKSTAYYFIQVANQFLFYSYGINFRPRSHFVYLFNPQNSKYFFTAECAESTSPLLISGRSKTLNVATHGYLTYS